MLSTQRRVDVLRITEIKPSPGPGPEHESLPERERRAPHGPAATLAFRPVENVDPLDAVAYVAALVI